MPFLVLHPVVGSAAETAYEPIAPVLGEAPRCPRCGLYVGMKAWLPPYRVRLRVLGDRVGDVAFGSGGDLLLSDAFVEAWRKAALQGLGDAVPVQIETIQPEHVAQRLSGFHHVAVQREDAAVDPEGSHIVRRGPLDCKLCEGPGLVEAILGFRIAEGSWNGADLFMPWGLNGILVVTERVAALAAQYNLANVTTTPVEEYRWDPLRKEANRVS